MQLKRDTDYALRIMICIAECLKENGKQTGMPVSSVITGTGIPVVTFNRIFSYLENHGLLKKETSDEGEAWIYPGNGFWNQSLLSIGEAVEGNMKLFVIFDRNSYIAQAYGDKLKEAQSSLDRTFGEMTMESFVEGR